MVVRIHLNELGKPSYAEGGKEIRYIVITLEDYTIAETEDFEKLEWIEEHILALSHKDEYIQFAKTGEKDEEGGDEYAITGDFQLAKDFKENTKPAGRPPAGKKWMPELDAWVYNDVRPTPAKKKRRLSSK